MSIESRAYWTKRRHDIEHPPPGYLSVDCWCRQEIVHVTIAEVRAILTRSCGRPECRRPPDEAA